MILYRLITKLLKPKRDLSRLLIYCAVPVVPQAAVPAKDFPQAKS